MEDDQVLAVHVVAPAPQPPKQTPLHELVYAFECAVETFYTSRYMGTRDELAAFFEDVSALDKAVHALKATVDTSSVRVV